NDIAEVYRRIIAKEAAARGPLRAFLRPEQCFVTAESQIILKCFKLGVSTLVLFKHLLHKTAFPNPLLYLGVHVHPLFKSNDTAIHKPRVLGLYRLATRQPCK